jgi:hypothetical protein
MKQLTWDRWAPAATKPGWDKRSEVAEILDRNTCNGKLRMKVGGSRLIHQKLNPYMDRTEEGTSESQIRAHRVFAGTLREWDHVPDAALTAPPRVRHAWLPAGAGMDDDGRIQRTPAAYGAQGVDGKISPLRADRCFSSTLRSDAPRPAPPVTPPVTSIASRLDRQRPQGKLNRISSERARRERIAARSGGAPRAEPNPRRDGWLTERARRQGRQAQRPAWGAGAYPGRDGWLSYSRPWPHVTEVRI